MFEINKLIESDIDQLREIGWILYNTDGDKGLSEEDTYKVIKLLSEIDGDKVDIESRLEDAYDDGYSEGYRDASNLYDE